jgi:hypothetical protein
MWGCDGRLHNRGSGKVIGSNHKSTVASVEPMLMSTSFCHIWRGQVWFKRVTGSGFQLDFSRAVATLNMVISPQSTLGARRMCETKPSRMQPLGQQETPSV